jgi:hypothetical protein
MTLNTWFKLGPISVDFLLKILKVTNIAYISLMTEKYIMDRKYKKIKRFMDKETKGIMSLTEL